MVEDKRKEYRGYWIQYGFAGYWWIETKDGQLLSAGTRSEEEAKQRVDEWLAAKRA